MERMGRLVVLVREYEEALAFYRDRLDMAVLFDAPNGAGRFLHLGFGEDQSGIWLIRASTPLEAACIGKQTAGQPIGVLYTRDIARDVERFLSRDVEILAPVTEEGGARHCHFRDLYGNRWVLVQLL